MEKGDAYWIYVVDDALSDDLRTLHAIQNPAAKVWRYLLDDGWRQVVDDEWQLTPSLPAPELTSEVRPGFLPFFDSATVVDRASPLGFVDVEMPEAGDDWFAFQITDRASGAAFLGETVVVEPLADDFSPDALLEQQLLVSLQRIGRQLPCGDVTVARLRFGAFDDEAPAYQLDLGPLGVEQLSDQEFEWLTILGIVHL